VDESVNVLENLTRLEHPGHLDQSIALKLSAKGHIRPLFILLMKRADGEALAIVRQGKLGS